MNYFVAAAALRAASAHPILRKVYRRVGNRRSSRPIDIAKSRWVWSQIDRAGKGGSGRRLLELGTGWTHANSLYTALLTDARIVTFDISDHRSFACTKSHIAAVAAAIAADAAHAPSDKARARERAAACAAAPCLEDLYRILNLAYCVDPAGIPPVTDGGYDVIYSVDVLEHVEREAFASIARAWRDLLKPGGTFIAQVGLDDHLTHFDKTRSTKEYVCHPERVWRRVLFNRLQNINQLTARQIPDLLRSAGFAIDAVDVERCAVNKAAVHPDYRWQSDEELEAVRLRVWAGTPTCRAEAPPAAPALA